MSAGQLDCESFCLLMVACIYCMTLRSSCTVPACFFAASGIDVAMPLAVFCLYADRMLLNAPACYSQTWHLSAFAGMGVQVYNYVNNPCGMVHITVRQAAMALTCAHR